MCGRYTLTSPDELVQAFGVGELPYGLSPRYNIAPTQAALVMTGEDVSQLQLFRWGLIPPWGQAAKSATLINARAETVDQKPAFRAAFAQRRCLVCCDGFYEWKREGKQRLPHFMHRVDKRPFAMAGIWERSETPDKSSNSFAIVTTEANPLMQPIHHRMPVLIAPEHFQQWLDPRLSSRDELEHLLRPPTAESLEIYQVSESVNKVSNDSPACLRSGPDQQTLF